MKTVFLCILKLIFISLVSPQSSQPSHVCEYTGVGFNPVVDIPFSVSDVPKRCDLVVYGSYFFDLTTMDDKTMYKHDEDAIKSLVAAGIPVWTYAAFNVTEATWEKLLNNQDDELSCPLIQKINELQLNGIILDILNIYAIPDMANKISAFVTKLKEQLPNVKFGLNILAFGFEIYKKIPNKDLFDYTITNSVIDLYFIDVHNHNYECTPELLCEGTLITSSDKNALTLDFIGKIVSESTMDKSKTIACIVIFPLTKKPNSLEVYTSYSKYCETPDAVNSSNWCLDRQQKLYDIGTSVKQYFGGIAVDWMEFDDVQCSCECSQTYPVANTLFDGWDGTPMTSCPKLE